MEESTAAAAGPMSPAAERHGAGAGGGPPPPPSPLSGCYLLIIIGEPYSPEHRDIILQRVAKGFLSWDINAAHVDLEKELQALTAQAPEGEEARNGERLIQYATENLVTEVLIHPQVNTLQQCVRNLLSSFTRHRHLVHAGYTFAGSGSWCLQDGTFSLADFIDAFQETEVQRVLRAYENCVTVDIHCSPEGDWTTERLGKESFSRLCKVRVNPDDCLTAGSQPIANFINYLTPFLRPASIEQLLEPSDVVGNIRFSHPTLYVFPGGQGDAALFGINGFNMLVDGGFARKACFWDFARHLDRLDAVLITRLNNGNVNGISAVLRRKKQGHVYPQIGHFFCNVQERRHCTSPDGDKDRDPLLINLADEGHEMVLNLRQLQLRPHACYREGNQVEPVNLYHKVGHGKLDMYIISPSRDSREVKEFLSKWNSNDHKLFGTGKKDREFNFPLQNLISICALLVWQPANPTDTITRILFPGSTPQHKIFEGLEKLRHLEFLKFPVCSARSLSPSASTVGISSRASSKQRTTPAVIDKLLPGEGTKSSRPTSEVNKHASKAATIPVAGSASEPKQVKASTPVSSAPAPSIPRAPPKPKTEKASKIEPSKPKTDVTKSESEKISAKAEKSSKVSVDATKPKIEHKSKIDTKTVKSRTDSKPPRSSERKIQKGGSVEKKTDMKSSPTTPKKSLEAKVNGVATKSEVAKVPRTSSKTRPSPSATPAKSTKEANNRKVVESKYHVSRVSASKASTSKATKKDSSDSAPKTERKPISRRPKTGSPTKAPAGSRAPGSPAKSSSAKSTPTQSVKSEKDAVIRKPKPDTEKLTTDSSAVSTPSTAYPETAQAKSAEGEEKPHTLMNGDLTKEEKTVVQEIEDAIAAEEAKADEGEEEPEEITKEITEDIQSSEVKEDETGADEEMTKEEDVEEINKEEAVEITQAEEITEEVEKEDEEEGEADDKESEVVEDDVQLEKKVTLDKEEVEATEEEQTEDIEDMEEDEPPIDIRESLHAELELEAKRGEVLDVEETEGVDDEEEEYLVIEKEEIEQTEESMQEPESLESHIPDDVQSREAETEDEGEMQKHLRDEADSEKLKKSQEGTDLKVNGFHHEADEQVHEEEIVKELDVTITKTKSEAETKREEAARAIERQLDEAIQQKQEIEEKENLQKDSTEEGKEESAPQKEQIEPTEEKKIESIVLEAKEQIQEEVQEIISSAKEIVTKTKLESEKKSEAEESVPIKDQSKDESAEEKKETEEVSSTSPEEKVDVSSEKNKEGTDDTRDTDQKVDDQDEVVEVKETGSKEILDQKYPAEESQPDEKFSTTVESAATTAPTLPEDERIPLDEIKEIVEEKHVKEETKEKEKPAEVVPRVLEQPTTLPQVVIPAGIGLFDQHHHHPIMHRDIVKTPDEVADLPVHEEVDPGMYESEEYHREISKQKQEMDDIKSPEFDSKEEMQIKYDIKQTLDEKESQESGKAIPQTSEIKMDKDAAKPADDVVEVQQEEVVEEKKSVEETDEKQVSGEQQEKLDEETIPKVDDLKLSAEDDKPIAQTTEEQQLSKDADKPQDIPVEPIVEEKIKDIKKDDVKVDKKADAAETPLSEIADIESKDKDTEKGILKEGIVAASDDIQQVTEEFITQERKMSLLDEAKPPQKEIELLDETKDAKSSKPSDEMLPQEIPSTDEKKKLDEEKEVGILGDTSALSATYLEIIEKLQNDKIEDKTDTSTMLKDQEQLQEIPKEGEKQQPESKVSIPDASHTDIDENLIKETSVEKEKELTTVSADDLGLALVDQKKETPPSKSPDSQVCLEDTNLPAPSVSPTHDMKEQEVTQKIYEEKGDTSDVTSEEKDKDEEPLKEHILDELLEQVTSQKETEVDYGEKSLKEQAALSDKEQLLKTTPTEKAIDDLKQDEQEKEPESKEIKKGEVAKIPGDEVIQKEKEIVDLSGKIEEESSLHLKEDAKTGEVLMIRKDEKDQKVTEIVDDLEKGKESDIIETESLKKEEEKIEIEPPSSLKTLETQETDSTTTGMSKEIESTKPSEIQEKESINEQKVDEENVADKTSPDKTGKIETEDIADQKKSEESRDVDKKDTLQTEIVKVNEVHETTEESLSPAEKHTETAIEHVETGLGKTTEKTDDTEKEAVAVKDVYQTSAVLSEAKTESTDGDGKIIAAQEVESKHETEEAQPSSLDDGKSKDIEVASTDEKESQKLSDLSELETQTKELQKEIVKDSQKIDGEQEDNTEEPTTVDHKESKKEQTEMTDKDKFEVLTKDEKDDIPEEKNIEDSETITKLKDEKPKEVLADDSKHIGDIIETPQVSHDISVSQQKTDIVSFSEKSLVDPIEQSIAETKQFNLSDQGAPKTETDFMKSSICEGKIDSKLEKDTKEGEKQKTLLVSHEISHVEKSEEEEKVIESESKEVKGQKESFKEESPAEVELKDSVETKTLQLDDDQMTNKTENVKEEKDSEKPIDTTKVKTEICDKSQEDISEVRRVSQEDKISERDSIKTEEKIEKDSMVTEKIASESKTDDKIEQIKDHSIETKNGGKESVKSQEMESQAVTAPKEEVESKSYYDQMEEHTGDGEPPPSPGDDYIDSGLEEEPIFTKIEAPEHPEYVMVTPDSTPASPKALPSLSKSKVLEPEISSSKETEDAKEKVEVKEDTDLTGDHKLVEETKTEIVDITKPDEVKETLPDSPEIHKSSAVLQDTVDEKLDKSKEVEQSTFSSEKQASSVSKSPESTSPDHAMERGDTEASKSPPKSPSAVSFKDVDDEKETAIYDKSIISEAKMLDDISDSIEARTEIKTSFISEDAKVSASDKEPHDEMKSIKHTTDVTIEAPDLSKQKTIGASDISKSELGEISSTIVYTEEKIVPSFSDTKISEKAEIESSEKEIIKSSFEESQTTDLHSGKEESKDEIESIEKLSDHTAETSEKSTIPTDLNNIPKTEESKSTISEGKKVEVTDVPVLETSSSTTVQKMLVTASSEDGGTETVLCAAGSITTTSLKGGTEEKIEKTEKTDVIESTPSMVKKEEIQVSEKVKVLLPESIESKDASQSGKSETSQPASEKVVDSSILELKQTNGHLHESDEDILSTDEEELEGKQFVKSKTTKTTTKRKAGGYSESTDSDEEISGASSGKIGKDTDNTFTKQEITTTSLTSVGEQSKELKSDILSDTQEKKEPVKTDYDNGKDGSSSMTTTATTITKTVLGEVQEEIVTLSGGIQKIPIPSEEGTTTETQKPGDSKDTILKEVSESCVKESSDKGTEKAESHISSSDTKTDTISSKESSETAEKNIVQDISSVSQHEFPESQATILAKETSIAQKDSKVYEETIQTVTGLTETKREAVEMTRSVTPGSDAFSDRDFDIGGPSTPHSDISSGQVSRAAVNVWGGSVEERSDSRHYESEDEDEGPVSPMSVTSQVAPSPPPPQFEFEMTDSQKLHQIEDKQATTKVVADDPAKERSEIFKGPQQALASSMTSSFYGSLPEEPPLYSQMTVMKGIDPMSASFIMESEGQEKTDVFEPSEYGSYSYGEYEGGDQSSKYGHFPTSSHMGPEESLDFQQALYEHRAARGEDLTSTSTSSTLPIESKQKDMKSPSDKSSSVDKKVTLPGVNGQSKEHSYHDIRADYGNGNLTGAKQFEDLMNRNRDALGGKVNGKQADEYSDFSGPTSMESFGQEMQISAITVSTSDPKAPREVPEYTEMLKTINKETGKETVVTKPTGIDSSSLAAHSLSGPSTIAQPFPEPPQGFGQPSMSQSDQQKDPIKEWGKPLGLPAPAPPPTNNTNAQGDVMAMTNTNKGTPKKEKKVMQMKKSMMISENNKTGSQISKDKTKSPESPVKQKSGSNKVGIGNSKSSLNPIYVDLSYVPHHGNSYYTSLEFFKKVRARYYVFSGTEPSREVYNALLEAKQTWEDKELEVTIIPTYDTDTLGYWVAENEDALAKCKIDLSPSASRCTINLQDHETSCSAYRLEF